MKDRIFRGPINSYVELTSDVVSKCTGSSISKANSKNTSPVLACPSIKNGAAVVYVDEKPANIRSWLVRGLAYYLVHIDGKIELKLSSPSKMVIGFVDQGDILKSQKHLAALIFLDEIAGSGKSKLNAFSHLLPQAVLGAANKTERDAAYFDPRKTNVDDRDAFAAYFSAEMIDSAICSDQSRKVLAASFPKTMAFYSVGVSFGLSENPSAGAMTEGPRTQVVSRTRNASAPEGLTPSSRVMYIQSQDGKETPTKLYERDGSQYWEGADGNWRQSPITTIKNGEQSVTRLDKLPSFVQPPAVSHNSTTSDFPTLSLAKPSYVPPPSIITSGGNSYQQSSNGYSYPQFKPLVTTLTPMPSTSAWAWANQTGGTPQPAPVPTKQSTNQSNNGIAQSTWDETPSQPASPSLPWYCNFTWWCQ
jgi:hypothetical protein